MTATRSRPDAGMGRRPPATTPAPCTTSESMLGRRRPLRGPTLVRAGSRARAHPCHVQPRGPAQETANPAPRPGDGGSGRLIRDHAGAMFGLQAPARRRATPVELAALVRAGSRRASAPMPCSVSGAFLQYDDPDGARRWWERAADRPRRRRRHNRRDLARRQRPGSRGPALVRARRPRTTTPAPCSLSGSCSKATTPSRPGAGTNGRRPAYDHAGAMFNLGVLLEGDDLVEAPALVGVGGLARPCRRCTSSGSCSATATPPRLSAGTSGRTCTATPAPCTTLGSCSRTVTPPRLGAGTSGRRRTTTPGPCTPLGVLLEDSDPAAGAAMVGRKGQVRTRPRRGHVQPWCPGRRQRPRRGPALVGTGR